MPAFRIIRYELLAGSVNDSHTIHRDDLDDVTRGILENGSDREVCDFVRALVGGERFEVDHSCDAGDFRVEFVDAETGDPAGAIEWDDDG